VRTSPLILLIPFLFALSGRAAETSSCLPDVRATFEGAWSSTDSTIAFPMDVAGGSYTQSWRNYFGFNNHFQGMQSVSENRFVISAGDYWKRKGVLILIDRAKTSPFRVMNAYPVGDRTFWHISGIASAGNILAAPMEAYLVEKNRSRIEFFDLGNFANPRSLTVVDRPHGRATAVALKHEKDGHYLLGVFSEASFDFYRSKTARLENGFKATPDFAVSGFELPIPPRVQNVNFLTQCDGSLYIVGWANTSHAAPVLAGDDLATLYSVDFEKGGVKVALVATKKFECGPSCNFAGAAGLDFDAKGSLRFFSPFIYRDEAGIVKFRTFRPAPAPKPPG
jgi:hypothetical protein